MRLLIRWIISALAIFVAVKIVPGIVVDTTNQGALVLYAVMAIVLGLVNAVIRPILLIVTCPLQIVTLGLFALVVNALCFWFASWLAQNFLNIPFEVQGFVPALLGSIVVSIVSTVLSLIIKD